MRAGHGRRRRECGLRRRVRPGPAARARGECSSRARCRGSARRSRPGSARPRRRAASWRRARCARFCFDPARFGNRPSSEVRSAAVMNGARRASLRSGAPLATPVVLSVTDRVGVTNARAAATRLTNAASAGASAKMCTSPLAPAAIASSAPWREPMWTTASLPRFFAAAIAAPSTARSMRRYLASRTPRRRRRRS